MNNKETFTEAMFFLAEVTGKNLSNVMFDFYYKDFEHSLEQATKAIMEFAKDGKWPSINQIWERMGISTKEPDDEAKARLLFPRITYVIGLHGARTQVHCDDSKSKFTEEEWEIITSFKPWIEWCNEDYFNGDNEAIIYSQFREWYKAREQTKKYDNHLAITGKANDIVKSLLDSKIQKQIDEIPF